MQPPVIALVGATASGKSAQAIALAQALGTIGQAAEIINADSMLVYRGMDIGTAKPSLAERAGVRHHLIDIMELDQAASVADFQRLARAAVADCRVRGVWPIVVGGSALYQHAILDHFDFPKTDPALRAQLQLEADRLGGLALYQRLVDLAPAVAAKIDPANARRIIRALEAVSLGESFKPQLPNWQYAIDGVIQLGLAIDRPTMDERIAKRVGQMMTDGLVEEVERLVSRGLRRAPTASRAIGYAQILAHLDGELSLDAAIEAICAKTRQFSRKQLSWWRRDQRIIWLDHRSSPDQLLATVNALLEGQFVPPGHPELLA
ncbi:MAG: tRNA (adenosine(37)-N6)-dimethylallyltransferase MiaA [Propionibacteriaceae bacterium]|jgi:tRNA dimethylallyltransferase|nr:tRNA (adenosine(37)-N6)-dimethylallyltransferase MiaA [Propionibacteriaceae bacterium]